MRGLFLFATILFTKACEAKKGGMFMKSYSGMVFGVTFGVVGGVLLGMFVHPAFWSLLPIGIGLGLWFDNRNRKRK